MKRILVMGVTGKALAHLHSVYVDCCCLTRQMTYPIKEQPRYGSSLLIGLFSPTILIMMAAAALITAFFILGQNTRLKQPLFTIKVENGGQSRNWK